MLSPARRKKLRLQKKQLKIKTAQATSQRTQHSSATQVSQISKSTTNTLSKKPADMTPADISSAIADIDTQIAKGKALLPASSSLLQRVLFALKMALLKVGGVDSELRVKDRSQLEALITAKAGGTPPTPESQANLTQAINDVKDAQLQAQSKQADTSGDTDNQALETLKTKSPKELTPAEISAAIAEIDTQIEKGKALLSAGTGLLQRVLFTLKMALLKVGGVDPELRIKDREQLEVLITESGDATPEAQANLTQAINDFKSAQQSD